MGLSPFQVYSPKNDNPREESSLGVAVGQSDRHTSGRSRNKQEVTATTDAQHEGDETRRPLGRCERTNRIGFAGFLE